MVVTRRTGESGHSMFSRRLKRSSRTTRVVHQYTDSSCVSDVVPANEIMQADESHNPVPTQKNQGGLSVTLSDSADESPTYTSRSGRRIISNKMLNDYDSTKYFKRNKHSPQQEFNSAKAKEKVGRSIISMDNDTFGSSKSIDINDTPQYKIKRSSKSSSKLNHHGVDVNGDLSYLDDDNNIRRSTRQRKCLYGTLNQSLLLGTAAFRNGNENRSTASIYDEATKEDMYSLVKSRHLSRRRLYPEKKTGELSQDDQDAVESGNLSSSSADDEEEDNSHPKYHLRPKKPSIDRFQHTAASPARRSFRRSFRSPMIRSPLLKSRRHATHNSSSTSSSSDDEMRFERRKAKSMVRARNHFLPMNFAPEDISLGTLRDRVKIGSSLADVDPMAIDKTVTFDSIGGLAQHLDSLKEMIIFPLLYPEVFENFKVSPPRGVLFHGPPGTGKTLVARALANECSSNNHKVAFFMRKGADCLSKWVGESERQLRLLFDQAYAMRPSIIFFDEIDGLAPVRSSRQDQIHSSIVSTLLALMDGLDSRGEVVVIGATNRLDAIDPALRRPGRFDREFHFPLPSSLAREMILKIHTKSWTPSLDESFISEVVKKCVGYCGADIKALCAEAALVALRKKYPQIYTSRNKLVLDISSVQVATEDFDQAMHKIVPAGYRATINYGRPLPSFLGPLLQSVLNSILVNLQSSFPQGLNSHLSSDVRPFSKLNETPVDVSGSSFSFSSSSLSKFVSSNSSSMNHICHRPRLLINGTEDQGQSTHIAPAILHHYEGVPIHSLDLPSLYSESSASPEESCTRVFREAKRNTPSIIYLPHIEKWWCTVNDAVVAIFLSLLNGMNPSIPVLLLATSDCVLSKLNHNISKIFCPFRKEVFEMENPSANQRKEFFSDLLLKQPVMKPLPPPEAINIEQEELELAPPPEPRKMSEAESQKLERQEENTMRELRIFLREVVNKLVRDRKFLMFVKPVDVEEVPDYHNVISNPMDLETMMQKIDLHKYECAKQFLDDIDLICSNALEYNPAKDRHIRHRACALRDFAYGIIETEMDPEFEKNCKVIHEKRVQRGEDPSKFAPKYYHTVPEKPIEIEKNQPLSVSDTEVNKNPPSTCNGVKEKRKTTSGNFTRCRRTPWFGSRYRRRTVRPKRTIPLTDKHSNDEKMDAEDAESNDDKKAKGSSNSQGLSSPANHSASKNNESLVNESDTSLILVNGCSDDSNCEANGRGLTVNIGRLKDLLNVIVDCTNNSPADKLESLYRNLQSSVHKHSSNYNRLPLIKEMEDKVKIFKDHYS